MVVAGLGTMFSILSTFLVRISDNAQASGSKVQGALNTGNWVSVILTGISVYFLIQWMLPDAMTLRGHDFTANGVFFAVVTGLVVGTLISIITEYYCSMGKGPVNSIVQQSSTGAATNIIAGLSVGMMSTALPMIVLASGIYISFYFAGLYGVAMAAAGMMATTAMQLAIDAFGPIFQKKLEKRQISWMP
jgi:K(+)-stimulated pyrophosphate-energized sodium pump